MEQSKLTYIEQKVERITESGCWIWIGRTDFGYGTAWFNKKRTKAHRFVYEVYKDALTKEDQLDHLCRVRCCVNPEHLEIVTPKVNILRGIGPTAINSFKSSCIYGHEFTEENTYYVRLGKNIKGMRRVCRTCARKRTNMWRSYPKEKPDAKTTKNSSN